MKAPFWFVEAGGKYRLLEHGEDTGITYTSFEKAKADVSARNEEWRSGRAPKRKKRASKASKEAEELRYYREAQLEGAVYKNPGAFSVFLARDAYNASVPWSIETRKLAKKAKRSDSLAGFTYHFRSEKDAQQFRNAVAVAVYKNPDRIPGGKADRIPVRAFDPKRLAQGIRHELEHTSDPEIASEIARDHLFEDPEYYDKLDYMERTYPPGKSLRPNRGARKMPVPEHVAKTSRKKAEGISAIGVRGQWPIGDLFHARLAAIYIKSPSHKAKKTKVLRALEHYYPEYDWRAFVGAPAARRARRRVANPR